MKHQSLLAGILLILILVTTNVSAASIFSKFQVVRSAPLIDSSFSQESRGNERRSSACARINQVLSSTRNSLVSNACKHPVVFSLATAASFGPIQALLKSQKPIRRAFYFWTHAGPFVVHYRFTQWWLDHSNADKDRRDRVYGRLHEKYCQPSLDIILHLKGL